MGDGRGARGERRELAPGAAERPVVQHLAAREHQRHHEPGLVLAEEQRPADRQQRDDVGAQLPAQHAPRDGVGERDDDRREHGDPEHVRRRGMPCEAQRETHREGACDARGNDDRLHPHSLPYRAGARIRASRRPAA
jgi:hypothetical protein